MSEFQGQAVLRLAVHDYAKVFVAGRLAGSISRNGGARDVAVAPMAQPLQTLVLAADLATHANAEGQVWMQCCVGPNVLSPRLQGFSIFHDVCGMPSC